MTVDLLRLQVGAARLEVAAALGGAITGFWWETADGPRHWLRPATAVTADTAPNLLACFPLVPFFGRIRDGILSFAGRRFRLPLNLDGIGHAVHGTGWQAPWTVAAREQDRLDLALRSPAGYRGWPWAFAARQSIHLMADGAMSIRLEMVNQDSTAMPAGLGLHPYFVRPPGTRLCAALESYWHSDEQLLPLERRPADTLAPFAKGATLDGLDLDHVFQGWTGTARLLWSDAEAEISASPPPDFAVLVAKPGRDVTVFEPVTHMSDGFNRAADGAPDTGTRILAPGEAMELTLTIRPRLYGRR